MQISGHDLFAMNNDFVAQQSDKFALLVYFKSYGEIDNVTQEKQKLIHKTKKNYEIYKYLYLYNSKNLHKNQNMRGAKLKVDEFKEK